MRRSIHPKDLLNPDRILANLLRDYVEGALGNSRVIYRAVVVKIDQLGGVLEAEPPNPKNSIQARVISDGLNSNTLAEDLPVFWPLSTHVHLPVKEGEHVYVIFDDENKQHGLWIDRIAEPKNVDNLNYVAGSRKYEVNEENELSGVGLDEADQDVESGDAVTITRSPEAVIEEIPPFTARVGDHVIHGSNNTVIVLGRDRPTNKESGQAGAGAGTVDVVAGRTDAENMNFATDKSRIYVSANTDADGILQLQVGSPTGPGAAIVIKSDQVRIVARNGMKLVVEGGDIQIDAQQILMGANAQDPAVKGNVLAQVIGPLLDALSAPAIGALGQVPIPPAPTVVSAAKALKAALVEGQILSSKNKVE